VAATGHRIAVAGPRDDGAPRRWSTSRMAMPAIPHRPDTALVLSAGGERVVAWEVGVLAGLVDVAARRFDVVAGTSAGSLVAARFAAGLDPRADADGLASAEAAEVPAPVRAAVAAAVARLVAAYQESGRRGLRAGARAAWRGAALVAPYPLAGRRGRSRRCSPTRSRARRAAATRRSSPPRPRRAPRWAPT
jgi:hypothetical protein